MALETEIRTSVKRQDRFGGFSTVNDTQRSLINPDFKPFAFGQETEIVAQEPAYEVEKQYDFDMGGYEKREESQSSLYMPTFERAQSQEREIVASSKVQQNAKIKLNARGKIIATVYSIIVAILVAFCIYNAVSIGSMQNIVASKSEVVSSQVEVINQLQNTYNTLGDADTIVANVGSEFVKVEESNIIHVEDFEYTAPKQSQTPTSWFEEFCQKIQKLFN